MLATGTIGFCVIEHYPRFDAFYMTLITVSTVGYAEIHPLSHAGRIFNSFVIFFGVITMFFAIGAMTQSIIELELGEYFGKRRVRRMIDKLEKHFIVCGYGRVGRNAARELQRSGVPFVVVDREPERVERAMTAGMLAVAADSTRDDTLRSVGVARARGLISALATDADNLFVILSAKNLNPNLFVATRAGEEEAEEKLRRAGADALFAPYTMAGYRLAQAVLRPHVFQFFDVATKSAGLDVDVEQVRVPESSEFAARSLEQTGIRRDLGVIVLGIRKSDGRMQFNPAAETVISGGDYLIVMGEPGNLRNLESMISAGARW
jgi:voltage-gated potassium channel